LSKEGGVVNKPVRLGDLISMREEMNRILSDREAALRQSEGQEHPSTWRPEVDIFEAVDRFIFHAELPGVAKEDFTVTIEDRQLILRGERRLPTFSQDIEHLQAELPYGPFKRTLHLPDNVLGEQISAHLSNGLLEIVIPKNTSSTPRRITVQGDE
jgi:HSP20 family protein